MAYIEAATQRIDVLNRCTFADGKTPFMEDRVMQSGKKPHA